MHRGRGTSYGACTYLGREHPAAEKLLTLTLVNTILAHRNQSVMLAAADAQTVGKAMLRAIEELQLTLIKQCAAHGIRQEAQGSCLSDLVKTLVMVFRKVADYDGELTNFVCCSSRLLQTIDQISKLQAGLQQMILRWSHCPHKLKLSLWLLAVVSACAEPGTVIEHPGPHTLRQVCWRRFCLSDRSRGSC